MGGRVRIAGVLAGVGALALSWGAVQAGAQPASPLRLVAHHGYYVAHVVPGTQVTFALVGEGSLTGDNVCFAPASGDCEIGVSASGPGGAVLAARVGGETVTAFVAPTR